MPIQSDYASLQDYFSHLPLRRPTFRFTAPNLLRGNADPALRNVRHGFLKTLGRMMMATFIALTGVGLLFLILKSYHIRKGQVGICTNRKGRIETYGPGTHLLLSPFSEMEIFDLDKANIIYGQHAGGSALCHIITVHAGEYGLALENGCPVVLDAGKHLITRPHFIYYGNVSAAEQSIRLGDVHLINIGLDQIGYGLEGTEVVILPPGRHTIQSATFKFHPTDIKNQSDALIECGPKKFLRIEANTARIVHLPDGSQQVLMQGFHVLDHVNLDETILHLMPEPIPLQVATQTRDNIPVQVKAAFFYKIAQPNMTIQALHPDKVLEHIKIRATCLLAEIVNQSFLSESNEKRSNDASRVVREGEQGAAEGEKKQIAFQTYVRDRFMPSFSAEMQSMGIEIVQFGFSQLMIEDEPIRFALAAPAAACRLKVGEAAVRIATAQAEAESSQIKRAAETQDICSFYRAVVEASGSTQVGRESLRALLTENPTPRQSTYLPTRGEETKTVVEISQGSTLNHLIGSMLRYVPGMHGWA